MAKPATAEKRVRRERGSINPDDIINGAFAARRRRRHRQPQHAVAGQAPRRRRDEHLLVLPQEGRSAQRDDGPRAQAVRVRHALRGGQGLARDVAQPRANHAKDVPGQPDPLRPHSYPVGAEPAGRQARRRSRWRRRSKSLVEAGLSPEDAFDTYSAMSVHVRGSVVLQRLYDKNRPTDDGPGYFEEAMVIDPETTPLLAQVTARRATASARPTTTTSSTAWSCILDHVAGSRAAAKCKAPASRAQALLASNPPTRRTWITRTLCCGKRGGNPRSALEATCRHELRNVDLDLDDDGAALAATRAHRGHADAAAASLQFVDQRRHHPRAGRGDGMTEAATAAGEVHQLLVEAVLACTPRSAPTRRPR